MGASLALAAGALRYRRTVGPLVGAEMARFERAAWDVADPELRALALGKLRAERFNAEAAAMVASFAPAAGRPAAARAILAVEVAFDYLDGRTELPLADPLAEGMAICEPFVAALGGAAEIRTSDPYLRLLALDAQAAIGQLPAREAVAGSLARCAARGVAAQVRMHAVAALGSEQLREWALAERLDESLGWRERLAACACSVLAIHALIAAAADPATTPALAEAIEAAYIPACATMTLLDGLIDRDQDVRGGQLSYAGLYGEAAPLAAALRRSVGEARRRCEELPRAAEHASVLAGAIAYWISSPGATGSEEAAAAIAGVRDELGALLALPLAMMRAWRALRARRGR